MPIEWVQTHNPQDVLLLACLLRQVPPVVCKAIQARLPRLNTAEEIYALIAIARCLSRVRARAARREVLEMIASPAVPLDKVELAATCFAAQQAKEALVQMEMPAAPRADEVVLSLGAEMTGLSVRERLAHNPYVVEALHLLKDWSATALARLAFLLAWLGGLLAAGALLGGLLLLAFVLLRPLPVVDWVAFLLDGRFGHYLGWGALAVSGGLLPVLIVLFPLCCGLKLYQPLRRGAAAQRLFLVLQQGQSDDSDPATLQRWVRDHVRHQPWHSALCAAVMRPLFVATAWLGGALSVIAATVLIAKPWAGLLCTGEWFWPLVVTVTGLGYLIYALVQFYAMGLEHLEDQV
jgi:hypothetical protein